MQSIYIFIFSKLQCQKPDLGTEPYVHLKKQRLIKTAMNIHAGLSSSSRKIVVPCEVCT